MRKKVGSLIDKFVSYILYGFLLLVVAVLLYILLVPRLRIEAFQNTSKSSRSLYRTSNNYLSDLDKYFSTLSDKDDLLIMQGCYQAEMNKDLVPNPSCYFIMNSAFTSSFNDIRSKMITDLQNFISKNKGRPIKGDVYVLLSQAPYLRDDKGNVLSVQYNISGYDYNPVNVMKAGSNVKDVEKPVFIFYVMFFVNYTGSLEYTKQPSLDIVKKISKNQVNKEQCYIKCQGDTTDTYCGCLNFKAWKGAPKSYDSVCSSTPLPDGNGMVDSKKNVLSDFVILYKINRLSSVIANTVKFDST